MTEESTHPPLTIVDDIRSKSPIPVTGLGHATVMAHPDARVVVLTFTAGHLLKEHSAPFPLIMQSLDGELLVRAGERETLLAPGAILRMDAALPHEVEAVTEARLMLTLITKQ